MKVLIYRKKQKMLSKSGIGTAFKHQQAALTANGVIMVENLKEADIAHYNTVFRDSYKNLKKAKKMNKPVVVHAHSTKEDFLNSFSFAPLIKRWFYRRLRLMYSKGDVLITVSPYAKRLIEGYRWTTAPIHVISNGIDVKEYHRKEEREEEFLRYFNLKKEDKVIVGIGFLFERKGVHDFIEIAKSFPDVKFIWFGTLGKLSQTKTIRKAIKNKPDNVIMPGYIKGEIVKGAISFSKALLFPSYEETEGIVVLEAMAAKTPVLIRDIPVYDVFTHEKDVLKSMNNDEFISNVKKALSEDLTEITNAAYQDVLKKDLKEVGKQIKKVYENLLKDK